jgi:hypothetical protein
MEISPWAALFCGNWLHVFIYVNTHKQHPTTAPTAIVLLAQKKRTSQTDVIIAEACVSPHSFAHTQNLFCLFQSEKILSSHICHY